MTTPQIRPNRPLTRREIREADRKKPIRLGPLRRMLPFVLRYPGRLVGTIAFLLISTLSSLAIPAIAGKAVDFGFVAKNLDMVTHYGGWIVLVAAVMALASAARFYFLSLLGERVLTDLRKSVFDHMLSLDATFFDTHRVGELTSRLNGDVGTIRAVLSTTLSITLRAAVTLTGAITLMFLTSPYMTLAVLVLAPIVTIPVLVISRRLRKLSRRTTDSVAEMSAMATEALGATRTVKSFVQEDHQSRQYSDRAETSFNTEVSRLGTRAVLIASVMFTSTSVLVGMLWWGSYAVINGMVTPGGLTQFMIYALMATNSVQNISDLFGTLQIVSGSTERLMEILDTKSRLEVPDPPDPLPVPARGAIIFDNVNFSYATRDKDIVVRDLSFAVRPGEKVALVGHSGAGKSTIFALMQRFYDVKSGSISFDGVDIRRADTAELRRRLSYVEQEPTIFAGTIADNIRFGRPEANDADIEAASRAALVHDFVEELEEGYDTIVGERGIRLSGGQKQRLAIARALLKNAPVLLLDEATSALDAQSESLVQIALARLMEGRTTIAIAHRLATIRDADRILVLDKGVLLDEGTHDELVRRGGRYAELAKLQFRDETPKAAE